MDEIGGYIELDTYHLPMLHEDAMALNCGRNALAWLIRARKIKKLWIPKMICDSITRLCKRENICYSFYNIGKDFKPIQEIILGENEWFYFINFYSQFDNQQISQYVNRYKRIIIDNVQSYFQMPIPGVDTIYTCRKYFGVADGAFLYTDATSESVYQQDESFGRMRFLLGRYERTAPEFYSDYVANNDLFYTEPIKTMSRLTRNLLHGIDYRSVLEIRTKNYSYLHGILKSCNLLDLSQNTGTFMYPLMLENGEDIRRVLQQKKIYIPTLWPDVYDYCSKEESEYQMAKKILPLPIDQRYDQKDLMRMLEELVKCMNI